MLLLAVIINFLLIAEIIIFLQKLKNRTSTGVYRIPCDDCSKCYIGETKRALTLRLREHQANCRNQKQHSAVVDHGGSLVQL